MNDKPAIRTNPDGSQSVCPDCYRAAELCLQCAMQRKQATPQTRTADVFDYTDHQRVPSLRAALEAEQVDTLAYQHPYDGSCAHFVRISEADMQWLASKYPAQKLSQALEVILKLAESGAVDRLKRQLEGAEIARINAENRALEWEQWAKETLRAFAEGTRAVADWHAWTDWARKILRGEVPDEELDSLDGHGLRAAIATLLNQLPF